MSNERKIYPTRYPNNFRIASYISSEVHFLQDLVPPLPVSLQDIRSIHSEFHLLQQVPARAPTESLLRSFPGPPQLESDPRKQRKLLTPGSSARSLDPVWINRNTPGRNCPQNGDSATMVSGHVGGSHFCLDRDSDTEIAMQICPIRSVPERTVD